MFQTILVPTDLTDRTIKALNVALNVAASDASHITLLHVIETIDGTEDEELANFYRKLEQRALTKLNDIVRRAAGGHAPINIEVMYGKRAEEVLRFAREKQVDLIVLARYMQVLSPGFVGRWPGGIINIHHSFLPAFVGARPYHQAKERGVKIIGATAHYVTADLDQGPIIEQDVCRVTHRDDVEQLVQRGRELERRVLTHAVRLHLERRVLITGNRTIVFG